MRNTAPRTRRPRDAEDDVDRWMPRSRVLAFVLRRPRDSFAIFAAGAAVVAIVVNSLFLQHGPHPAPIFPIRPLPVASDQTSAENVLPRARPADHDAARRESTRSRADIVIDIQRELARRGYYDGAADGVYGAKTDAAIRDFEQAAGLRPSSEPNEALLAAIMRGRPKTNAPVSIAPARKDAIADLLAQRPAQQLSAQQSSAQPPTPSVPLPLARPEPAPSAQTAASQAAPSQSSPSLGSPKVLAVQRALSDFGYGQLKPTGVFDADTKLAIQRFERDRRLPITGEMSDRLLRELAALTGRPLD